jgi:hypothetical protein
MEKVGPKVRKKILDDLERQKMKKQKGGRNINEVDSSHKPGASDSISAISKDSEERIVASILRGVM